MFAYHKGRLQNRNDFQATRDGLAVVVSILENTEDLARELNILQLADQPVIAMGILYYVHTMLLSEHTLGRSSGD